MTNKRIDFLLYILKCLIGTVIGFYLYRLYPTIGAWCLISIILVLAPDRNDAINLATTRIKANVVGAAIGLTLFYIHPINLLMICIGVLTTVVACELLKLQSATRSAGVAVLIIIMHEPGQYFWDIALERAAGVIGGCIVGMLITYIFHLAVFKLKR